MSELNRHTVSGKTIVNLDADETIPDKSGINSVSKGSNVLRGRPGLRVISRYDEDEKRLLPPRGSDKTEHDPEAVSITRPRDRRHLGEEDMPPLDGLRHFQGGQTKSRSIPGSGFKPTNTLSSSSPGPTPTPISWIPVKARPHTNRTYTHRQQSPSYETEARTKRRKIEAAKEISDSEGEDELSHSRTGAVTLPSSDRTVREVTIGNRGSKNPRGHSHPFNGRTKEYHQMEAVVNSNAPPRRRQGKGAGWSIRPNSSDSATSPDVVISHSVKKAPYRGTARGGSQRQIESRSRRASSQADAELPEVAELQRTSGSEPRKALNDITPWDGSKQQINSKQSAEQLSSDELQAVELNGGSRISHEDDDLDQPSYSSLFPNNLQKSSYFKSKQSTAQAGESRSEKDRNLSEVVEADNCIFAVDTIGFDREFFDAGKLNTLRLAINPTSSQLSLISDGDSRKIVKLSGSVKVQFAFDDPQFKVRIQTSSSLGELRDPKIDIEGSNGETFKKLLAVLGKEFKFQIFNKPTDYLAKAFHNRRQEHKQTSRPNGSTREKPGDIQLAEENQKRRRGLRESDAAEKHEPDVKRQRRTTKLTDRIEPARNSILGFVDKDESSIYRNETGQRRYSGIDEILGQVSNPSTVQTNDKGGKLFKHQDGNPHLTRSRILKDFRNPSFFPLDDLDESERYSRKHGFGKPWKHPLVYPKDGKKKVTVEFGDLQRLDEGQFLNDNIVEFYLRYLSEGMQHESPEAAKSVYWFNTYFFTTLTQAPRGKKINYDGVRKWTRNVDIFSHDFIVVPINETAHWYVALICNLPELSQAPERKLEEAEAPKASVSNAEGVAQTGENGAGVNDGKDTKDKLEALHESPDKIPHEKTTESFSGLSLEDSKANDLDSIQEIKSKEDEMLKGELENIQEKPAQIAAKEQDQGTQEGKPEAELLFGSGEDDLNMLPSSPVTSGKSNSSKKSRRKSYVPLRPLDPKEPAIIVLDSLGIAHSATTRVLKDYLIEEAKDKRSDLDLESHTPKGMTAKGIPQQDNFCDCGLYLLGYMDKFVENPRDFVTRMLRKEFHERDDWPKLRPSQMRAIIRDLIMDQHKIQESDKKEKRKSFLKASDDRPQGEDQRTGDQTQLPDLPFTELPAEKGVLGDKGTKYTEHSNAEEQSEAIIPTAIVTDRISRGATPAGEESNKFISPTRPKSWSQMQEKEDTPKTSVVVLDSQEERNSLVEQLQDAAGLNDNSITQSRKDSVDEIPQTPTQSSPKISEIDVHSNDKENPPAEDTKPKRSPSAKRQDKKEIINVDP